ncbi:hypothetical protein FOXYSP1_11060 [Fusarium oxysporum f. sp. phaseoli]
MALIHRRRGTTKGSRDRLNFFSYNIHLISSQNSSFPTTKNTTSTHPSCLATPTLVTVVSTRLAIRETLLSRSATLRTPTMRARRTLTTILTPRMSDPSPTAWLLRRSDPRLKTISRPPN